MSPFIVKINVIVDFCHIDAAVQHFLFHLQFQLLSGFHGDPVVFSMDLNKYVVVVMEIKECVQ